MPQCLTLTNPAAQIFSELPGLSMSGTEAYIHSSVVQHLGRKHHDLSPTVEAQESSHYTSKKPRNAAIPTHSYCEHLLMHSMLRLIYLRFCQCSSVPVDVRLEKRSLPYKPQRRLCLSEICF